MFTTLLNRRDSKTDSNSADFSGRSAGLPSALAMRPGVSVPVALPGVTVLIARVTALNVWSDVVAPGCTPDAPYALRRRSWSSQLKCGKKFSSLMIHEALSFG